MADGSGGTGSGGKRRRSGKPTMYKGVRFRSLLESVWAAFFDEMRWQWSYEAVHLHRYIPDFLLRFDASPMLLEVKPEVDINALRPHARKIVRAGWDKECLAVGAEPFAMASEEPAIGIIGDTLASPIMGTSLDRGILFRCLSCGGISVRSDSLHWGCRVCGAYGGNAHVGVVEIGEIERMWKAAKNRLQWRPGT